MSSRIPLIYSPKVLELFRNPKNLGAIPDAEIHGTAGSLACGDMIAIYIKLSSDGKTIEKAGFESYGCAANIAAASIMTEIIKGKSLEEAWNVDWKTITEELGGLPSVKYHCGVLAVGALRRAIRKYFEGRKDKPDWLPEDLTHEERHAIEEEKLMEQLSKRIQSIK